MSVFCAHIYQKRVQNSRVAPETVISRAGFPKGERSPLGLAASGNFFSKYCRETDFGGCLGQESSINTPFSFSKKRCLESFLEGF